MFKRKCVFSCQGHSIGSFWTAFIFSSPNLRSCPLQTRRFPFTVNVIRNLSINMKISWPDDLDVLYNRARRQIIYPVDQLGGNAPSERIVTVKVSSCHILLLVFHVFYICCLQPNRWSLTILFYYVYTGTLFSDSFEQKTDLGTKGENLSHAIENTGNQKARNHSIFCGMQWQVF